MGRFHFESTMVDFDCPSVTAIACTDIVEK